uniref:Uncharacterized protein TCIL3000_8_7910 n=1 Tax=Trypanosoma congolense (strain IL3000) TaxID=1068625 RepID=G0UT48_TRYCI|nr:unnamed protein product [Trypanosoma congolense IL3000]
MHFWRPTHCTLQLNFLRSERCSEGRSRVVRAGDAYGGTSIIRYERCLATSTDQARLADANMERENGLHFHAVTAPVQSLPKALPLTLQSLKVHSERGGTGAMKVLKVVDESNGEGDTNGSGGESSCGKGGAERMHGKQHGKKKSKQGRSTGCGEQSTTGENGCHVQQAGDLGSKYVIFEGGGEMPPNSIVTLTVAFTGRVQEWSQGGIYAGKVEEEQDAGHGMLLTHFEVAFARWAFPCPDDPKQYRIVWQLQTLLLPAEYGVAVSNTAELSRKDVGAKGVQYSFAPIGPLPAYVIAFAAFAGVVKIHEEVLQLRTPPFMEGSECSSHGGVGVCSTKLVPLRVITHATSGVTAATLAKVAYIAREAIWLLEDFFGSPLPLQQMPFTCPSGGYGDDYYHSDQTQFNGDELLTIAIVPTVPYISGMEHHGCMFLNETIYTSTQAGDKGSARSGTSAPGVNIEVERTKLIVHELAHHWMGNTLGMPFVLKEGVCQLMEEYIGDVIMGKPVRKAETTATAPPAPVPLKTGSQKPRCVGLATLPAADDVSGMVEDPEKGKEFTIRSYQKALNAVRDVVSAVGFTVFKEGMRRMYAAEVLPNEVDKIQRSGGGGDEVVGSEGGVLLPPPYVSSAQFMVYINQQNSTDRRI